MEWFIVVGDDGVILRSGICQDGNVQGQACGPGESAHHGYVEPGDIGRVFFEHGEVVPKKELPVWDKTVAEAGETVRVAGLPDGAVVTLGGTPVQVEAGVAEVRFDSPGIYVLSVSAGVRYMNTDTVITVAPSLQQRKEQAYREIAGGAEQARRSSGQSAVYVIKAMEARELIESGTPSRMLDIEAEALGTTAHALAGSVLEAAKRDNERLGLIEAIRRRAKASIELAGDKCDVSAIVERALREFNSCSL